MYQIIVKDLNPLESGEYLIELLTEKGFLIELFKKYRNYKVLDFQLIFEFSQKKDLEKTVFIHLN